MSSAVCRKRKAIVFIGGRKKFGGDGECECGMTQSNQKNDIFTNKPIKMSDCGKA